MTALDAQLLELGRQFDAALTKQRRAEARVKKTHAERDRLALAAGASIDDNAQWLEIGRQCGSMAAMRELNRHTGTAVRLMRAIRLENATTLAGFAVKLAAVVFDQFDFEANPIPTDVAEKQLLRLSRQMTAHIARPA